MSQTKSKSKLSVNGTSKKEVPAQAASSKAKKEGASEKKKTYKSDAKNSKEDDKKKSTKAESSKSTKDKNGVVKPEKAVFSSKKDLNGDSKKSSSKTSSKTSERTKDKEKKVAEEPPKDDNEEYAYEDDFEEYGSDFEEDFEDEESQAAPAPVNVSNGHHVEDKPASIGPDLDKELAASESLLLQRLSKPRSATQSITANANAFATTKEAKSPRISSAQRRFAFEHSKEVDVEVYRKVKERFQQLKELIGLETVHSVVTNIPAIRDYEFYMQTFGKGDRSQVACQTGEDDVDVNCQTDSPDSDSAWTQHPPSEDVGFGRENDSAGQSEISRRAHRAMPALGASGERFARFSAVVSELMSKILTPIEETTQNLVMPYRTKLAFSTGFADFNISPIAKEVRVNVVMPTSDTSVMRVAFYVTKSENYLIRNRSVVADFSVSDASSPTK
ncbi:WD repeat-containing protein 60-like isoform X1 [Aphelenchoides avenae]|nr:WD repeat-containing protein 60-like isoform X1 [Aphelenchus avenae]